MAAEVEVIVIVIVMIIALAVADAATRRVTCGKDGRGDPKAAANSEGDGSELEVDESGKRRGPDLADRGRPCAEAAAGAAAKKGGVQLQLDRLA